MSRLNLSQYFGFISIGLICSIFGAMLPAIQKDLSLTYSQAGILLSASSFGMIPTVLIGGFLSDKYGKKTFLNIGGFLLYFGLVGIMLSNSFLIIFVSLIISGAGAGIYEVGINALCSDSNDKEKGNALNFLHFFFGLGAILGPLISTMFLGLTGSWRLMFGFTAIFPVLVFLLLKPLKLSQNTTISKDKKLNNLNHPFIYLTCILILVYVGLEVSFYSWISVLWEKTNPESLIPYSLIPSLFWISLTIGRLFSGKIADKIGFSNYIQKTCIGVMILLAAWFLFPYNVITLIIIIVLGFFLSGIFPTVVASTTSLLPSMSGTVSSLITLSASLGSLFTSFFIGKAADIKGLSILPAIFFTLSVMQLIISIFRYKSETSFRNIQINNSNTHDQKSVKNISMETQ